MINVFFLPGLRVPIFRVSCWFHFEEICDSSQSSIIKNLPHFCTTGDVGRTGSTGPQGPPGPQGAKGPEGQGLSGVSYNRWGRTNCSGDATVVYTGKMKMHMRRNKHMSTAVLGAMAKTRPQHRENRALLFRISVWVL